MPRPTDKAALLAAAASEFDRLWAVVETLPLELRRDVRWQAAIEDQSRNPRDVLTHLHEWQVMTLRWCAEGDTGGSPAVPAPGRTWRDLPALNLQIWQRYEQTGYDDAAALLRGSHEQCLGVIEAHTDAELFTKGRYPWTKTSTLGAYFVSATSSHYVWGVKTLKAIARSADVPVGRSRG